jgi:hypothetical protein
MAYAPATGAHRTAGLAASKGRAVRLPAAAMANPLDCSRGTALQCPLQRSSRRCRWGTVPGMAPPPLIFPMIGTFRAR